jgi:hypothetical protein
MKIVRAEVLRGDEERQNLNHAKTQRREDVPLAAKPHSNRRPIKEEGLILKILPAAQGDLFAPLRLCVMKLVPSPRLRASA